LSATGDAVLASIIIPTKNEEDNIGRCLEAVFRQSADFPFEVLVIDSGSGDRTVEIVRKYPVRLVEIAASDFHHARTRNLGAETATGDFLVYLSADAFPATDRWLANLLRNLSQPGVGAVYGRQIAKDNAAPERAFFMNHRYGSERRIRSESLNHVPKYRKYQLSTVNCAIAREVWTRTRFPEELNAYEDIGIAIRIAALSYSIVYEPEAPVFHSHNYALWYSFKQYFDCGVVYRYYGMWDDGQIAGIKSDGWQYLLKEMRYLVSHGASHRCPYVACYEFFRYLGVFLGRNERLLPRFLKRNLSSHHLFG
jgi:glycosyltransferase involved in cell wall biosynthesis